MAQMAHRNMPPVGDCEAPARHSLVCVHSEQPVRWEAADGCGARCCNDCRAEIERWPSTDRVELVALDADGIPLNWRDWQPADYIADAQRSGRRSG